MKIIRFNIFETNSSSTNTLCIGQSPNVPIPYRLTLIDIGWEGRDFSYGTAEERFSVIASLCNDTRQFLGLCYKLYEMGVKEIVLPNPTTFKHINDKKEPDLGRGEVDESEDELMSLIEPGNEEELKHFIFDDCTVLEGRDDNYDW